MSEFLAKSFDTRRISLKRGEEQNSEIYHNESGLKPTNVFTNEINYFD